MYRNKLWLLQGKNGLVCQKYTPCNWIQQHHCMKSCLPVLSRHILLSTCTAAICPLTTTLFLGRKREICAKFPRTSLSLTNLNCIVITEILLKCSNWSILTFTLHVLSTYPKTQMFPSNAFMKTAIRLSISGWICGSIWTLIYHPETASSISFTSWCRQSI